MAKIKGLCRNEDCELCDQIQEAEKSNFVCERCGKELIPFGSVPTGPDRKKVILLTCAGAIICCAIACFLLFAPSSGSKKIDKETETAEKGTQGTKEDETTSINVERLSFMENGQDVQLKAGEEKQLNIDYVPDNADEGIKWRSEDINIVTVSNQGFIKAVSTGSTNITAVTDRSGISATMKVTVTKEQGTTKPATGTLDLGYATYEGDSKNGKPEGNGTMTFKKKCVVPGSKGDIEAQPGEYAIGRWHNGQVNVVTLYQKDGNQVTILHKLTGGA